MSGRYRTHGLTGKLYQWAYDCRFRDQGGKCAICERGIGEIWRWNSRIARLVLDHNHTTGRVRGLVCGGCNTHIGNVENGKEWIVRGMGQPIPDYLEKIMAYLEKFQKLDDQFHTDEKLIAKENQS